MIFDLCSVYMHRFYAISDEREPLINMIWIAESQSFTYHECCFLIFLHAIYYCSSIPTIYNNKNMIELLSFIRFLHVSSPLLQVKGKTVVSVSFVYALFYYFIFNDTILEKAQSGNS